MQTFVPEGVGAGSGKGKFVDGCPPGTGPPDPGKFPRNGGCAELGGVRDTWSAGVVGVEEVQLKNNQVGSLYLRVI